MRPCMCTVQGIFVFACGKWSVECGSSHQRLAEMTENERTTYKEEFGLARRGGYYGFSHWHSYRTNFV